MICDILYHQRKRHRDSDAPRATTRDRCRERMMFSDVEDGEGIHDTASTKDTVMFAGILRRDDGRNPCSPGLMHDWAPGTISGREQTGHICLLLLTMLLGDCV